jgi:hypothetical protein
MKDEEVLKLRFDGWPLPDTYLIELGRITALWGVLESLLNVCLGKLAGFNDLTDPTPFILLTHSSFPQRLDMLGSLCGCLSRDHPNLGDYQRVISSLKTAQKVRNKYTHHGMDHDEKTGEVTMATGSARGSLKVSTEPVTLADVRRASMAIHQATADLYKLVFKREVLPMWERRRCGDAR